MKKLFNLLFLLSVLANIELSAQNPNNQISNPLATDNAFVVGKLNNGLTYYIRHAENPAKSAEFFIIHNVGSLQEEDKQKGLAHFLEHMAFNGTKNFPDKNMLNYLASIGVKFGYNVNAYTSMDRTVYNISAVPMIRTSVIDSVLLMLHDWSGFISCQEDEVNAERGVIIEEWRRNDDVRTKMLRAISAFEHKDSKFALRPPIGDPNIIANFKLSTLTDFYHKWYRPDLQAIAIVGDFDVKDMEARVKKILSKVPITKNPAPRESFTIPDNKEICVGSYTDKDMKAASVRLIVRFPNPTLEEKQTELSIKQRTIADLLSHIASARSANYVSAKKAKYKALIPSVGDIYYTSRVLRLTAVPNDGQLTKALVGILEDYERLSRYGVGEDELNDAKITKIASLDKEQKRLAKASNADYINLAVENFTRGEAIVDIPKYFATAKRVVGEITVDDINSFIRNVLNEKKISVFFTGSLNDSKDFASKDRVCYILDSIKQASLDKYVHISKNQLNFRAQLSPVDLKSKILPSKYKGTKEITLSNGNKIYWIEAKGGTSDIKMRVIRPGGYSSEPDNKITEIKLLENFLPSIFVNGMNKGDFRRFCVNNQISFRMEPTISSDMWSGKFNAKSAENFFKILYMSCTDVEIDTETFRLIKEKLIKGLKEKKTGRAIFRDSCDTFIYQKNALGQKITLDEVSNVTPSKILEIYKRHFADISGASFVFYASTMNLDEALKYLEKYVANLPYVDAKKDLVIRNYLPVRGKNILRYKTDDLGGTKASVCVELNAKYSYTQENAVAARFLTHILRERYTKSIREEKGGTYHVGVTDEFIEKPYNNITYSIDFDTNPKMVDELIVCVWDALKSMAKDGPSKREMDEIKLYMKKMAGQEKSEEKNLKIMSKIISDCVNNIYVDRLDLDTIEKVNASTVQKLAKELIKQKNYRTFILEPKK